MKLFAYCVLRVIFVQKERGSAELSVVLLEILKIRTVALNVCYSHIHKSNRIERSHET